MADIISFGEKHKRIIKIAENWARKKMGNADVETIHKDLLTCGNPVLSYIARILNEAADLVDEKRQGEIIRNWGELFIWFLYKDTGYRDQTFWILWQLLEHADELKPILKEYAKPPEDWYVNVWNRSKKHTKERRDKGDLPKSRKSIDESIFTPPEQVKRLEKI